MYLYYFDITNQKIIQYNDDSNALIVDLFHPLLSFIRIHFLKFAFRFLNE